MSHDVPSVSVAIPTFNEEAYIERVVRCFLNSRYENVVQVMIADGGSSDGTRRIVDAMASEDSRIELIDNPMKVQAAGLNLMIEQCRGDIFLRADAHSDYDADYIERSVEHLLGNNAVNAGGAQRFVAATPFQAGVALASRSFLGSGSAKYRDPSYDGFAETVFLGCFWRDAVQQVGDYNEDRAPNEDADLNIRLWQRYRNGYLPNSPAGTPAGAVYVSSEIRAWYYPRTSFSALWKQYFSYGRGRCKTVVQHPGDSPLRSIAPVLAVVLAVVVLALDLLMFKGALRTPLIALGVMSVVMLEAIRCAVRSRDVFLDEIWRGARDDAPGLPRRILTTWLALMTMPIAYSYGFVAEIAHKAVHGSI